MTRINYRTLNLNLLRVFDALFQYGNVTAAGEALGVSQSAVSHALNQLRYLFEDELFVRSGTRMVPTAVALEFGERIHQALEEIRDAVAPAHFDPATTTRCFTFACGDNIGTVLVSGIIGALRQRAPNAKARIVPLGVDLVRRLDQGKIDVALSSFTAFPGRMKCDLLWSEAPVWVVRQGHPALGAGEAQEPIESVVVDLTAGEMENYGGYVNSDGLAQWATADAGRTDSGVTIAPGRVVVPNFMTAMAIVAKTDLATLLPRRLAGTIGKGLGLVPLPGMGEGSPGRLMALWSEAGLRRPEIGWLRELVLERAGLPAGPDAQV